MMILCSLLWQSANYYLLMLQVIVMCLIAAYHLHTATRHKPLSRFIKKIIKYLLNIIIIFKRENKFKTVLNKLKLHRYLEITTLITGCRASYHFRPLVILDEYICKKGHLISYYLGLLFSKFLVC